MPAETEKKPPVFTADMKNDYTILIPNMAIIHFTIIKNVFSNLGFNLEILTNDTQAVVDRGLKYVHNDTCYPALLVIGQMIDALESGKYDPHKVALMITQTGGGCRASNYIHLLRKALKKAGYDYVPVISLNLSGLEKGSAFQITIPMLRKVLSGLLYGDLIMLLKNQVRPYEDKKGDADDLVNYWIEEITSQFNSGRGFSHKDMKRNMRAIAKSFASVPMTKTDKVKVCIVGEIYVKYSPLGNNDLEEFLYEQDCEVLVPGILGFAMYSVDAGIEDNKLYGGSLKSKIVRSIGMKYLKYLDKMIIDAVKTQPCFVAPSSFEHTKSLANGIIGHGVKMGEGWLLTAEMVEGITQGYNNIICAQPFGCLPNHIVGKGMIRKIKEVYDEANIVPIDYDPGATKVNQENRIKLMLSVARAKSGVSGVDKVKKETSSKLNAEDKNEVCV